MGARDVTVASRGSDQDKLVQEVVTAIRKHPEPNRFLILDNVFGYLPPEIRMLVRDRLRKAVKRAI